MTSRIHDLSLIVTDTEAEALILEDQLIKKHHPRYNVALRDGKSYPYCKLTVGEMYPRLLLVREKIENILVLALHLKHHLPFKNAA